MPTDDLDKIQSEDLLRLLAESLKATEGEMRENWKSLDEKAGRALSNLSVMLTLFAGIWRFGTPQGLQDKTGVGIVALVTAAVALLACFGALWVLVTATVKIDNHRRAIGVAGEISEYEQSKDVLVHFRRAALRGQAQRLDALFAAQERRGKIMEWTWWLHLVAVAGAGLTIILATIGWLRQDPQWQETEKMATLVAAAVAAVAAGTVLVGMVGAEVPPRSRT